MKNFIFLGFYEHKIHKWIILILFSKVQILGCYRCQNVLILVSSSGRRSKLPFLCPLVDLFLRGVAKQKKLQDEGFICSGASLGCIGYASGWEITIKSRWIICWVIYKELMYSSRIDLLFELLLIRSLIFNIPKISWHGWYRKNSRKLMMSMVVTHPSM